LIARFLNKEYREMEAVIRKIGRKNSRQGECAKYIEN